MTITGGSALPKDDIDRMMREAEQYADEDHKRREAAETRNQAEQLVYQTEKFIADNADKVPGDVKSEVETAIAAAVPEVDSVQTHIEPLGESGPDLKKLIKLGEWNDVVLVANGNHVVYSINGHVMSELIDDSPAALREGVLALQLHAGFTMDVRFKDVRIKMLR